MQVHITARHLDLTPALTDYVQKKLDRVSRHFPAVLRAQMVLAVEKHRHIAEIVTHANGHHDFRAKGESLDLYAAVDIVAEKLHKHMARHKDRRVRGRRGRKEWASAAGFESAAEPAAPLISRVKRFTPPDMTPAEAIEEMERIACAFLVFSNEGRLNVVYKRQDASYGLLEPDL